MTAALKIVLILFASFVSPMMCWNVMGRSRVDPAHAQNITAYHVNPRKYGAVPVNMDTGDAAGDLFFDLFEVIIAPLACPHGASSGHGCTNPEAVAPDLMVNKLTLEVDTRYSAYAKCNICINGTDQRGHKCPTGTYFCYCSEGNITIPCQKTIGREDLYTHFGEYSNHSRHCNTTAECYRDHVMKKLTSQDPGYWYSSLADGYCDAPGGTCTWRVVSVDKIVTRQCHSKVFGDVVQASAPTCVDNCGTQRTNTSSPCWVDCFYKAALGPNSGQPGGAVTGIPLEKLIEAWEKPFLPESEGGCPAQEGSPSLSQVVV